MKASNPPTSKKRSAINIDARYTYINTLLDLSEDNLREGIEKSYHAHNECWINTLLDLYKDTLFLPSEQERFRFDTRETLLHNQKD